jgi:lipopolysaccharide/colanic/teichoic acid biosynthesis glycosyltransferase
MSVTPMETATEVMPLVEASDSSIALRVPVSSEFVVRPTAPSWPQPRREAAQEGRESALSLLDAALKRTLDVLVAGLALALLLPLIVFTALLVRLDSPGPAFFRCDRAGHLGRRLRMLKFRKMHDGATGSALAATDDERFTRLGWFLARTKLDEVPQLWNVLRGQMSLVGPRPEDPTFIALHREDYEQILSVRPGITGYCQLAFARESEILDENDRERHYVERILPQKVALDCLYAAGRSFVVDLKILWWTAMAVVLSREVAVNRETGKLGRRAPRTPAEVPERSPA